VLVPDGAYVEAWAGGLDFVEAPGQLPPDIEVLEQSVLFRFEHWLRHHGYLDDDPKEPEDDDSWWLAAAQAPSGVIALVAGEKRRKLAFEVHATVRVRPGDKVGREQLVRYVTRPLRRRSAPTSTRAPAPLRSGQKEIILHPLALLRRLAGSSPRRATAREAARRSRIAGRTQEPTPGAAGPS
jgi:hypothetical protein